MSKAVTKQPSAELIALTIQAQQVLEFMQSGYRVPEIAEKLQISRSEVRRAFTEISRREFEAGLLKRDALRAQAAADLDYMQHELEEAWEESKPTEDQTGDQQIQALVDGTPGSDRRITIKRKYEHGDARYLQLAKDTLQAKIKLLGLNAAAAAGPQLPDLSDLPAGTSAVVEFRERLARVRINTLASQPIASPQPPTHKPVEAEFTAPPPPDFQGAVDRLRQTA